MITIEENENLTTRMLAEDFNINYSTYQKVGKSMKIGWMDHQSLRTSLTPTNLNTYDEHQSHEYVRIYINLKQTNSVPKESRHWRRFSLKTSKERRFAFRQVLRFYPKKYRCTVKNIYQTIWFDKTKAKSSTRKSSQTKFVISGMTMMSINSGGFQTKIASSSAISPTHRSAYELSYQPINLKN